MVPFPGLINRRRWLLGMVIGAVARQIRRLFGPCGAVARQHFLAATVAQARSGADDFAAWVAYRKAKEKGGIGAESRRRRGRRAKSKGMAKGLTASTGKRGGETGAFCGIVCTISRQSVRDVVL